LEKWNRKKKKKEKNHHYNTKKTIVRIRPINNNQVYIQEPLLLISTEKGENIKCVIKGGARVRKNSEIESNRENEGNQLRGASEPQKKKKGKEKGKNKGAGGRMKNVISTKNTAHGVRVEG